MHNLLRFVKLNQSILLFLILESFSIFLFLSNNKYQNSRFILSINEYASIVYSYSDAITNYIHLKEKNKFLSEENAKLLSLIERQDNKTTGSINSNNNFIYKSTKIINNSINKRNNYLTLNKGRLHGVKKGMGVTTHLGVIGIIKEVSDNFSSAISILHSKSKLSVILKKSNYFGTLEWDGMSYLKANLNDIPSHVKISIGDTIVTSGYSHIFQSEIPIGIISRIKTIPNKNFHEIKINFLEDFKKIKYVNLNELVFKNELKILEKDYE